MAISEPCKCSNSRVAAKTSYHSGNYDSSHLMTSFRFLFILFFIYFLRQNELFANNILEIFNGLYQFLVIQNFILIIFLFYKIKFCKST